MSALIRIARLHFSVAAIFTALVSAGCMGPFHFGRDCKTCGATADVPSCEPQENAECESKPGWNIHPWDCCVHASCRMIDCPCQACRRVVNICVPDDVVGPSQIQGPGRFHPVPTREVFAPSPEPLATPSDL